MGVTKRLIEHYKDQRRAAIKIALEAGALSRCEVHGDCLFDGPHDTTGAYKLGHYKFKKGELRDLFNTPREMTDWIKKAVEDNHGLDECPRCAKFLSER